MENFIKKLKQRIEEEESRSLKNIKEWRKIGEKESTQISTGEIIAFGIVKDIIKEIQTN